MKKKTKPKFALTITKRRLNAARSEAMDVTSKDIRRDFMDKFTLCDVTCKSVLEFYNKAKGTYTPGTFTNLNMRIIPSAMNYLGLSIPQYVLNGVFGGSGQYKKRGTKSAKKLRDGIVHGMNKEDIREVVNRNVDLNNIMDSFLTHFV